MRFVYATSVSIILSIIFAFTLGVAQLKIEDHLIFMAMLVTSNIEGVFSSYTFERFARRDFILTRELEEEQRRSENLLLNILPPQVAKRLKSGEKIIADDYPEVSVLFTDIVNFKEYGSKVPPNTLVESLNMIFTSLDDLVEQHGLEKIKTIGDAYMLVGGLP